MNISEHRWKGSGLLTPSDPDDDPFIYLNLCNQPDKEIYASSWQWYPPSGMVVPSPSWLLVLIAMATMSGGIETRHMQQNCFQIITMGFAVASPWQYFSEASKRDLSQQKLAFRKNILKLFGKDFTQYS